MYQMLRSKTSGLGLNADPTFIEILSAFSDAWTRSGTAGGVQNKVPPS